MKFLIWLLKSSDIFCLCQDENGNVIKTKGRAWRHGAERMLDSPHDGVLEMFFAIIKGEVQ